MTTGISLVRENAVSMQPPRSVWVTFPLGRPLGKPNDPAFQHRVISAALELLNCDSGPVLVDYAEDAPSIAVDSVPACPVSFHRTTLRDALLLYHELFFAHKQLRPFSRIVAPRDAVEKSARKNPEKGANYD